MTIMRWWIFGRKKPQPVVAPPRPSPAPDAVADWKQYCRPDPLSLVPDGDALELLGPCVQVFGTLVGVVRVCIIGGGPAYKEGRGLHILVSPDDPKLLSRENITRQHGCLVIEAAPEDESKIIVPRIGTHVQVIGAFVKDKVDGWNMIKPAFFIGIVN
jgi:hypothetical protein